MTETQYGAKLLIGTSSGHPIPLHSPDKILLGEQLPAHETHDVLTGRTAILLGLGSFLHCCNLAVLTTICTSFGPTDSIVVVVVIGVSKDIGVVGEIRPRGDVGLARAEYMLFLLEGLVGLIGDGKDMSIGSISISSRGEARGARPEGRRCLCPPERVGRTKADTGRFFF